MINIEHKKIGLEELNINELFQKPTVAIQNYWNGTNEELYQYYQKHNIDYNFKFDNLEQLHEKTENYLTDLMNAVEKDISKFDFRLRSALKPRNLNVSIDDYMKVEFDITQENSNELINKFLNSHSRSFLDFRHFEDEKLTLYYNRKGIVDEGNRIAIVKAKQSVTLRDEFKEAKDNNFIMSGIIKELAKNSNLDFTYQYMAGDVPKVMSINADEINKVGSRVEEKNQQAVKEVAIRKEAEQEITKEKMQTRQSLEPDSNSQLINKEATSEIRIDTKKVLNNNTQNVSQAQEQLTKVTDDSISDYEAKEIEKVRIRLEKAKNEAKIVYDEIKRKINDDGFSIQEALNFVKQKYREEHTINLASVYLTKDILEVKNLENIILNKDNSISSLEKNIEDKNETITKREETISSLKSTLQTKENDLRLKDEHHAKDIEIITNESKKLLDEMTNDFEEKINESKQELKEADELIIRLSEQKTIYEKELVTQTNTLKTKDEELINLKSAIHNKNNSISSLEKEIQELKRELEQKDSKIQELETNANNLNSNKIEKIEQNNEKILKFLEKLDIIPNREIEKADIQPNSRVTDILNRKNK
jgi:SH3-like domain-containing protein